MQRGVRTIVHTVNYIPPCQDIRCVSRTRSALFQWCSYKTTTPSLSTTTTRPKVAKTVTASRSSPKLAPDIALIRKRLTNLTAEESRQAFQGEYGQWRLARFMRLHAALQNISLPEPMWEAYQDIRKNKGDFSLLSPEVPHLLVVHFKSTSTSYKNTFSWEQRSLETKWAARIITVLMDKRKLSPEFSRWDSSDLMQALNRVERYEEALSERGRLLAAGTKMDPILLNHTVRALAGLGRLDEAMQEIRESAAKYGIQASEYTLGYIVQQLLLTGQRPVALDFWKDLIGTTVEDIDTLNGILRACVKNQDSEFSQIVYDSMPAIGVESNVESLSLMLSLAVVEIQYNEERSQFLETINNKIATSDKPVFDKSILDSILVNFCKKGDLEGAILVHHLMRKHGFPPSTREHNMILHGFIRLDRMEKALDWFQHMRQTGISPDRSSYVLLIQAYARNRMPRETEALFRQMLLEGIEPDRVVCNYLLLAYEQARMNRRCLELYHTMFRERIGLDAFSFSCMFSAVFHSEKALLEGEEGLGGQGSALLDSGFLRKISEPVGRLEDFSEQGSLTLDNESSRVIGSAVSPTSKNPPEKSKFQFDQATSHTLSLEPRSLFRDMVIVGLQPSRSLYSNILRAFLSKSDYAGAAVAMKTLVDYYALKPSPKMSAIAVAFVCKEIERRGFSHKENSLTKGELVKIVKLMKRTRGLIEILEKAATVERWGELETAESETSEPKPEKRDKRPGAQIGFPGEAAGSDSLSKTKMEMGGDLVDLDSKGVPSGSTWNTLDDNPLQIDLEDFARWYNSYSSRTTGRAKEEQNADH